MYHADVAPILEARCQSCHAPGKLAPFSLLSFADAHAYANDIARAVASRTMPPWRATTTDTCAPILP